MDKPRLPDCPVRCRTRRRVYLRQRETPTIELAAKVPAVAWIAAARPERQRQSGPGGTECNAEQLFSETAVFAERGLEPDACFEGNWNIGV
jgi:hypothetical protein